MRLIRVGAGGAASPTGADKRAAVDTLLARYGGGAGGAAPRAPTAAGSVPRRTQRRGASITESDLERLVQSSHRAVMPVYVKRFPA